MNHIYRLVWSKSRGMLVAVSEIAGSHGNDGTSRRLGTRQVAFALALAGLFSSSAWGLGLSIPTAPAGVRASDLATALSPGAVGQALPTGGQVMAGQATLSQSGTTLTIHQSTAQAILNWQNFSIGAGDTVDFSQPDARSVTLNRVLGADPSVIFGRLNANGQVFLTNANGIYFAPGAQVNVGGLVASTLGISNTDFLSGTYHFNGSSTARVTNAGTITTTTGGTVAFIGNTVSNTGTITTPGGSTALGAGAAVNLTLAGDQLVNFQVSQAALNAEAANGGVIQANGGRVILSAQAKSALLKTVVNTTGQIQAQTVANQGGSIVLLGGASGTVTVGGLLDASAPNGGNGGQIETSGAHVSIANDAVITTKSATGQDGHWLIDPNDFTIAASGGDITGTALSAALGSSDVTIQTTSSTASCTGATCGTGTSGNGDINVNDTVAWSVHTLTLNAYRDININTAMNGSDTAGLALLYGQGSANGVIGGVTSTTNVNAPVNLASAGSFSTQLGSSGGVVNYIILTSLGAQGSTNGTDLQGISGHLSGDYVLGSDIDASATSSWDSGAGFVPLGYETDNNINPMPPDNPVPPGNATDNNINPFSGVFDGLGHTVSGLTIDRPTLDHVGLFGEVNGGTVRNVGLVGGSVNGGTYVGGLVGYSNDSTISASAISHAYATGDVNGGNYVGGLVGYNSNNSTISDAYATGSVSGSTNVGGLVGGTSNGGKISGAYATGNVSGRANVGGLAGRNSGTISDAYATGRVSGSIFVGGLVAGNYGTVSDVYATGSVNGSDFVGGLVGYSSNSTISNAYATGSVSGSSNVGGLVGWSRTGTFSDAYATGSVTGSINVGGLVGYSSSSTINDGYWDTTTTGQAASAGSPSTNGLTTAQMMQQTSFTGFDFTVIPVWVIYEGKTAPLLSAFMTPATINNSKPSEPYNAQVQTGSLTLTATGTAPGGSLFGNDGVLDGSSTPYGNAVNVGTYAANLWSDQQGYLFVSASSLTITPANLTVIGEITRSTYTAAAQTNGFTTSGLLGSDSVTGVTTLGTGTNAGTYDDNLTAATGTGLSNYAITYTNGAITITPAALTVTGLTGTDKTYDGSTLDMLSGTAMLHGLVGSQTLTIGTTMGTLASANAGSEGVTTAITLSNGTGLASNYTLTQATLANVTVAPATLTVSGLTGTDKTYDGTTNDPLAGTAVLSGLVGSQTLTLGNTSTGTLASANVGNQGVTTAITLSDGTGLARNYTLAQPMLANVSVNPGQSVSPNPPVSFSDARTAAGIGPAGTLEQGGYLAPASGVSPWLDPRQSYDQNGGQGKPNGIDVEICTPSGNGNDARCHSVGTVDPFAVTEAGAGSHGAVLAHQ